MSPPREREATLAVVSQGPERVADRIAELRALAGFILEPLAARDLRDVYLDRDGGELRGAGLALRLRRARDEESPLLAVKGPGRPLAGGGTDRLEVEGPWGAEALAAARAALGEAGLPGELLPAGPGEGDPLDRLLERGWRVVQDRRTRRRPRRIRAGEGAAAGELAVDEVGFRPGGRRAVHREVEVEALHGGSLPPGVVEALLDLFPQGLRRWEHPKLATGRALERLLAGEEAGRWVGPGGALRPAAYDRLEALLEGG